MQEEVVSEILRLLRAEPAKIFVVMALCPLSDLEKALLETYVKMPHMPKSACKLSSPRPSRASMAVRMFVRSWKEGPRAASSTGSVQSCFEAADMASPCTSAARFLGDVGAVQTRRDAGCKVWLCLTRTFSFSVVLKSVLGAGGQAMKVQHVCSLEKGLDTSC